MNDCMDETKTVNTQDKEITFNVALKAGAKLQMQSWFYDANGRELCGAYYAYVRRKWGQDGYNTGDSYAVPAGAGIVANASSHRAGAAQTPERSLADRRRFRRRVGLLRHK